MQFLIRILIAPACWAWVAALSISLPAYAFPPGFIPPPGFVLDQATGNYTFPFYRQNGSGTAIGVYTPRTKRLFPMAQSTFSLSGTDTVVYGYTIGDGAASLSTINWVEFTDNIPSPLVGEIAPVANETIPQGIARHQSYPNALRTPPGWKVYIGRSKPGEVSETLIAWKDTQGGILPGGELSGFGFASLDLPGVAQLDIGGNTSNLIDDSADPDGIGDGDLVMEGLYKIEENDYPTVNAAAPMIAVPSPFDPAVTLEVIQTHVHTWVAKQLLNAAFSAQLDTSFQAAIAAYRVKQPLVAKTQLETLRALIKQQQPDADKNDTTTTINLPAPPATIDLLAARILYFDLGYVMNR